MVEFIEKKGLELAEGEEPSALLVGVYSGASRKQQCTEHLEELEALADTFGVKTLMKFACPIRKIEASTFLQKGKLEQIFDAVEETKVNLVIIDEEISPAQQRNLEKLLKVAVMDRTELILEIFASRAQTKEARLQIELAKTQYEFPRLKRLWSHFSRQRASGGYLKGEGEKQIEIDKRLLKKKVEKLSSELKEVKQYREIQSASRRRSGVPTFAIIGYTNAGKSTLLNALTQAEVLVEDKLFATLDPTTRRFTLPNNQEILLTDTVGFIRKLPHSLIAAFRSTLEAALHDDVLIHLVDVSHPLAEEQADTTYHLLKELGVVKSTLITVLNKVDLCADRTMIDRLRIKYPKTVVISATQQIGFEDLVHRIIQELKELRQILRLKIPQNEYELVAILRREGKVLHEEYEGNDVLIQAEVPLALAHRFDRYKEDESENVTTE